MNSTTLQEPAGTPDADSAMPSPPPQAREILLVGSLLGAAAVYFLWYGIYGPGFAAWLGLLGLAALFLARERLFRERLAPDGSARDGLAQDTGAQRLWLQGGWTLVVLVAALLLVWRSMPLLDLLLRFVILLAAAFTLLQARGGRLLDARIPDMVLALVNTPWQAFTGTWPLLRHVNPGQSLRHPRLPGILRGAVLTLPVWILFAFLFGAADAAFGQFLLNFANTLFPASPRYLLLFLGYGWIATGLLAGTCRQATRTPALRVRFPLLGTEETAVLLGSLCLLFAGFMLLQAGYLFGGAETIEALSGLTLAEYARRGFFELLAASGLTLGLLLAVGACTRAPILFQRLGLVLVFCVLVILASAVQRLLLYTTSFGLSLDRVVALAFLGWLACNLLAFAATVLRGQARAFAACLALSGIAAALLLALANPVALVVRGNLARVDSGAPLDLFYLLNLGPDAVSPLLEGWDQLDADQQCQAAFRLLGEWPPGAATGNDWRNWHGSHARATAAVTAHSATLQTLFDAAQARAERSLRETLTQSLANGIPRVAIGGLQRVDCRAEDVDQTSNQEPTP